MKVYIIVDKDGIIKCMASETQNLWEMDEWGKVDTHYVERRGTVGDYYDKIKDEWIPKPENYPKPNKQEIEQLILGLIKKKSDTEQLEILLDTSKSKDKEEIDKQIDELKKLYEKVK